MKSGKRLLTFIQLEYIHREELWIESSGNTGIRIIEWHLKHSEMLEGVWVSTEKHGAYAENLQES
ncbi:hypothetical protein L0156_16515 [bacterium]|nr:hypothetical protein [bacterium]